MKILIIVGGCLKVNSSANLCHRAYIQGFIDSKHEVTVVSMSDAGQIIDESINLPKGAKYFTFNSSILLKYINPKSRKSLNKSVDNKSRSLKTMIFSKVRKFVLDMYGNFGYTQAWIDNTVRNYKGDKEFDLVISLSSPVASHVAAHRLIKSKKLVCKKLCQIWEDPWQYDIYKDGIDENKLRVEEEITTYADKVIYVSPITMSIQKSIFKSSAVNMDWCPLPFYYKDEKIKEINATNKIYGYFGDYFPETRNLEPFYLAAKDLNIKVNICGMPNTLFKPNENISIKERLPLNQLKEYEDITDVLVFVCNLKGGQIPGKIYQYSSTNRYILFILDGTEDEKEILKNYFSKFNRYVFCNNDIEDITRTIQLIENNKVLELKNDCVNYFEPRNIAKLIIEKCKM